MAKLFGKRGKGRPGDQPAHDPRSAFAVAPLPRHAGPPASSTPLADQLGRGGPGVTEGYVVLPRGLAEQMPLPWQHQAASILAQFHHTHHGLSWPRYRVLPSREERLVDLDEEQLAEAGYVVELDVNGELTYRERNGRKVENPEQKRVLVTCLDPVQPQRPTGPAAASAPQVKPGEPVPMNIGPQPVWDVVPSKAHREPALPPQPPPVAPPAVQPPPVAPPAAEVQPPPVADEPTPPSGIPVPTPPTPSEPPESQQGEQLDWFAEPSEQEEQDKPLFGPSGDPIERPYRYGS